jgi:hypothetical protein
MGRSFHKASAEHDKPAFKELNDELSQGIHENAALQLSCKRWSVGKTTHTQLQALRNE